MKVAILVDSLAVGGAERQAILCTVELRKLGHRAELVYYRPKVEYTEMLLDLGVVPAFVQARSFLGRCHRLRVLLEQGSYDVVHGFKMAAEIYAAVAGTWAGVRRRFGCFRSVYDLGWRYRLLHHEVDKWLDGWIVNSEAVAESMSRLARIPRRKFEVVHNGFATEALDSSLSSAQAKAKLGLSADSVVVTMVARLERPKNYPLLLQVAKKVVSSVPKARFLVVGKGSLEAQLRRYAGELGLGEQVVFLGQRSDMGDILTATDISVLTSDHEGLPNAIIEAMAAGKAIVCTEFAGAREIMIDAENALLSPCGAVDSFAAQVVKLIREPSLRSRLGQNAAKFAGREFSPRSMARRLEQIYLKHESASQACPAYLADPADVGRSPSR